MAPYILKLTESAILLYYNCIDFSFKEIFKNDLVMYYKSQLYEGELTSNHMGYQSWHRFNKICHISTFIEWIHYVGYIIQDVPNLQYNANNYRYFTGPRRRQQCLINLSPKNHMYLGNWHLMKCFLGIWESFKYSQTRNQCHCHGNQIILWVNCLL